MKKLALAAAGLALALSATTAGARAIETIPGNLDTGSRSFWSFFFG